MARAEAVVQSFKKIRQPQVQSTLERKVRRCQHWRPPPPMWFKVNVDAAVREEQGKEGLGVIIKNSDS